jgi:NADH-quinone oxidoreductase subunit N
MGVKGTKPREAALKYVIFGAVASGLMIYGLSLVYGLTGTTKIYEMGRVLADGPGSSMTLYVACFFIIAGFAFKVSAVPFHMWSPDVYEGAPTPITAFLSVGPKLAGFAALVRFFYGAMSVQDYHLNAWIPVQDLNWPTVLAVISAVTMTLGNLAAIPQTNIKRMLAYSSIAHAGYMLMGFVLLRNEGLYAIIFYAAIYLAMNLGAFLVVIAFASKMNSEETSSYAGLGWRSPVMAVCFAIFLFSLTGLPPLGGFTAKFLLFAAVIKQGVYWLAIIAVINSVISLYYYAGIVRLMFLVKPENPDPVSVSPLHAALIVILAIPLLVFGVWWGPLEHFARFSSQFYLGY